MTGRTGIVLLLAVLTAPPARLASQANPVASLLAADRAAADSSARCGYGCALGKLLAPDAIVLYAGMPVVQGAEQVGLVLSSQAPLAERRVQWLPQYGETSADGQLGVTWGVITSRVADGPIRFGQFITVWRRDAAGWRVVAHVQTVLPEASGMIPAVSALVPLVPGATARPFVEADRAFAAQAGRDGAAAAFAAFAAPDAVTVSGAGTLNRGPEAIRRALSGGPPADWVWGPVAAGASPDGTLGWTVGEATISARGGSSPPYHGKYLTVWRRDADGKVRFITDGGNSRPPS